MNCKLLNINICPTCNCYSYYDCALISWDKYFIKHGIINTINAAEAPIQHYYLKHMLKYKYPQQLNIYNKILLLK